LHLSEVSQLAGLAVDAGGEVLALLADAAALHVAMDVHGLVLGVDLLVVAALVGVAVAVAGLTLIRVFPGLDLNRNYSHLPNCTALPLPSFHSMMIVPFCAVPFNISC
jgi:hypothetical protein